MKTILAARNRIPGQSAWTEARCSQIFTVKQMGRKREEGYGMDMRSKTVILLSQEAAG